MLQDHVISILIVLSMGGVVAYKASFLKNKRLFKMSIHQILYLFVLPSTAAILLHYYAVSLVRTPRIATAFIPDGVLLNLIFLSMLFIYAAKAVHVVTKALHDKGLTPDTEAGKLNDYLHLNFSHNFLFSGMILLGTSLVLLELNHITDYSYGNWLTPIIRGALLGVAFVGSMFNYTRPDFSEDYEGARWSDLRIVFALSWIALVVIISASQIVDVSFKNYQFLLPIISTLALVNVLNVALILRPRLKKLKHKVLY